MDVYASVTTIPSRVNRTLRRTLESLVNQETALKQIIVTVPTVNMRGQDATQVDLDWIEHEFGNRVRVNRPAFDWGPVMKYVGCADIIPPGAVVFVGDDDQAYARNRVTNLLEAWKENDRNTIVGSVGKVVGLEMAYGFRGLLVPIEAIQELRDRLRHIKIPRCCAMNDDVLATVCMKQAGFRIVNIPETDVFVGESNLEKEDALHATYKSDMLKVKDMVHCHLKVNAKLRSVLIASFTVAILFLITGIILLAIL